MTEQQNADQGKQESEFTPGSITHPVPDKDVLGKYHASAAKRSDSGSYEQPPIQAAPTKPIKQTEDELQVFERESLRISREMLNISRFSYRVTIFAFLAAAAAAIFIGVQVKIMSYQTQVLASQSESGAAGSLLDGMNTRKQLDILQRQAQATQSMAEATKVQASAAATTAEISQKAMQPAIAVRTAIASVTDSVISYNLMVRNEGGSSVRVLVHWCSMVGMASLPYPTFKDCTTTRTSGPSIVLPHNDGLVGVSSEKMEEVIKGNRFMFTPVQVEYPVVGDKKGNRKDEYCFYYNAYFRTMGECGSDLAHPELLKPLTKPN